MLPDLAGFRDAQERKRAAFGEPVTFRLPEVLVWPDGTALDPESGRPHDPLAEPEATLAPSVTITATIATSTGRKDGDDTQALGVLEVGDVMVIASSATASATSGATHVEARGESFLVRRQRFDGVSGIDRYLTFGEREGPA